MLRRLLVPRQRGDKGKVGTGNISFGEILEIVNLGIIDLP
jgi:hypothetical protein